MSLVCIGDNERRTKQEILDAIAQVLWFADREGFSILELSIGIDALKLIEVDTFNGPNDVTKLIE